jgi:predicted DNA-binding antitoxin AbrB/MazE fold protein
VPVPHPVFCGLAKNNFPPDDEPVMTTTVEAIYEHGKLLLSEPLSLPEKSHVRVTIESDTERETWLKLSEEALMKTWDNDADDVFNELLKK